MTRVRGSLGVLLLGGGGKLKGLAAVELGLECLEVLGRHAELEELGKGGAKVVEELVLALGVALDVLLERLVLHQRHVGHEHHEALGRLVLELGRAVPLAHVPLFLHEQVEVLVGERGGGKRPGTLEAGAVGVATAEGVRTGERHDLLVVEAHLVKDVAQVVGTLVAVRQAAVGSALVGSRVLAARAPGDLGTAELLDGGDTAERPEVRVGDPGELVVDLLHKVARDAQTGVGAVVGLGGEAHGGTVGAASVAVLVVRARCVPCEAHEHGAERAVVVVRVGLELLGDGVVHRLVVGLGVCAGGGDGGALGARKLVGTVGADTEQRLLVILAESKEGTAGNGSDGDRGEQHLARRRAARGLRRRRRARRRAAVVTHARAHRGTGEGVDVASRCSQRLGHTKTSAKGSHLDDDSRTEQVGLVVDGGQGDKKNWL
ncbi:hypothetical protein L1887_60212 [Cichorium endivia]|nr:hypothetical protein L1887_60212 [Cichorium endivia]